MHVSTKAKIGSDSQSLFLAPYCLSCFLFLLFLFFFSLDYFQACSSKTFFISWCKCYFYFYFGLLHCRYLLFVLILLMFLPIIFCTGHCHDQIQKKGNCNMLLLATTTSGISFDSTITISIILAICALFAPSITAIINNWHQFRIRKLELQHDEQSQRANLQYEKKFAIYKEFLSISSGYPYQEDPWCNKDEMERIIQNALLVCDEETRCHVLDFQKLTSGRDGFNEFESLVLITKITLSFSRELNSLSMEYDNKRK